MLVKFIKTELQHFRKLTDAAQKVLEVYAVYEFVYPLLTIFVNAFILRQTNDFLAVAMYNFGSFFSMPLGFYLNGLLLKHHKIHVPFLIGMVGQGIVAFLVFFLSFQSFPALFLFGLLQGFPMGIFWGNRNFINLEVTHDESRTYFTGLEMILSTIAATTMPLLVGWTIQFGDSTHIYSASLAYKCLGLLGIVVLFLGGKRLASAGLDQPKFQKLWLGWTHPTWNLSRVIEVLRGIQNAIDLFMVPLVIFTFLGREGSLGTLQSAASLIGIVMIYALARFLKPSRRVHTVGLNVIALVTLSMIFAISFSQWSALLYVLFSGTIALISWMASNPISMKLIDDQENGDKTNNYAYVCDRELFLNVGRVIGVVIFYVLVKLTTQELGLRFIPLLLSLTQVIFYVLVSRLAKVKKSDFC